MASGQSTSKPKGDQEKREEHHDEDEHPEDVEESDDEELMKAIAEGDKGKADQKAKNKGKDVKRDDDVIRAEVKENVEQLNKSLGVKTLSVKKGGTADMQKIAAATGSTAKKFNLIFTDDAPWEKELKDVDDHFSGMDNATAYREYVKLATGVVDDEEEEENKTKKKAEDKKKKGPKI